MTEAQRVEVEWLDSVSFNRWAPKSDHLTSREDMVHRSVGYVLDENEDRLQIAQSYGVSAQNPNWDASMSIPKVAILHRWPLRKG